jgi:signal transduction histidine kinase
MQLKANATYKLCDNEVGVINFQDTAMISAARAHVSSLRWRLGVWAVFALGASFVTGSVGVGAGWFLALALSTLFDAMLGHSYLDSHGARDRGTAGVLFVWGCFFSAMIFAAMTLYLAGQGGGSGRVLAVLMAASAFVRVLLFLSRAPGFMTLIAAPAAICLLAMPFVPQGANLGAALMSAVGVGCGVVGFLAYVLRAVHNNNAMMLGLRAANEQAKQRQIEAEVKRGEAEAANRAKSEFIAMVSHELRTPLNAVIGYAEIIEEDLAGAGNVQSARDASQIEKSARHLLSLIDQILSAADMDASRESPSLADIDVRKLIEDAAGAVEAQARERGSRLAVRVAPQAERAVADGGVIATCIGALLSNAVTFTTDGLIAVSAERQQIGERDWLVVAVSDTGIGIAAADLPRIFMPFTQIDAVATRTHGGMGLGLSLAQRSAQVIGGDIAVSSELGVGSTFTLRVPLHATSADQARARSAA